MFPLAPLINVLPEAPEPLNLSTIHNDCKQLIFEYLEWSDLVNVADTSKQLYAAVCNVFKRKYGSKKIDFGFPLSDWYVIINFESSNVDSKVCIFF